MRYLDIPGIPVPISVIGLGGRFGEVGDELSFELLDGFVSSGGTLVDTACSYANGRSEIVIGSWMAARRNRQRVVVVDKGCHPLDDGRSRVRPEAVREDVEKGLCRLQTDYIDLFFLHRDDPGVPVEALVDALLEEISAGRIHTFGLSNWHPRRLHEAYDYMRRIGSLGLVAASSQFSLAVATRPMWPGSRCLDEETQAWHLGTRLPLFAWSAQARGWFSGRCLTGAGDRSARSVYLSAGNLERLARARRVAARHATAPTSVALAAVLHQLFPVVALVGPETRTELEEATTATTIQLSPDEVVYLEYRRGTRGHRSEGTGRGDIVS